MSGWAAGPAWLLICRLVCALVYLSAGPGRAATGGSHGLPDEMLDDFHDLGRWQASASDQVQARLSSEKSASGGTAMCLHYDFGRVSGYAVARRSLALDLPAHYGFTLRLRGHGAANALQVKWLDASGDNVWWRHQPEFTPPRQSIDWPIRQRQIDFAWGPTSDKVLRRPAALELVVASGSGGGAGRLCFERLTLHRLPAPGPVAVPVLRQTPRGSLLDLGSTQQINGLLWRWADAKRPATAEVQLSDDGHRWRTVQRLRFSHPPALHPVPQTGPLVGPPPDPPSDPPPGPPTGPGWQALWLPDQAARFVRLVGHQARASLLQAPSPAAWPDRNALLKALASHAPRSQHARSLHGEQNYWTVVAVDGGGANAALVGEDGEIEPHRAGPSLMPMVITAPGVETGQNAANPSGRQIGWAEVQAEGRSSATLREGHLPLPTVSWQHPAFGLDVEAGAVGDRQQAQLIVRYTLHNPAAIRQRLTLALLLRPWQVNPPQQFLNTPGGVAEVRRLRWTAAAAPAVGTVGAAGPSSASGVRHAPGGSLQVNGQPWLTTLDAPGRVTAAPFGQADVLAGTAPPLTTLHDGQGLASARLDWTMDLAPGERRSISISLPLAGRPAPPADSADAAARLDASAATWHSRLNRVRFTLPPAAQPLQDSLRAALSHILMSRSGPALQPGTRSYARSWVRDGAMMVAGLLRLGEVDAARAFVTWYATQLFANGKVPCCVDARGADPVAENDSHGQFIFAVAELWRYSQHTADDRARLLALWPAVDAAARYLEQLRQSERSALNQQPGRQAFWGLLPASISHEGYSAKPMHSHWDNFWALAGWRDAGQIASALGKTARADQLAAQHDEFRRELGASLAITLAQHRIDHLPGAAELGDFDPSSSTLIFSPAGAESLVAPALLQATWQRYWDEARRRRPATDQATDAMRSPVGTANIPNNAISADPPSPASPPDWADYTPYELRSVSALLRLGHPDRALAMLDFFLQDQRPAGWRHWAEVVGRQPRQPRFIGDMPHAWISSDFIRSALDLLAYQRDSDDALVLAAGVPAAWLAGGPVGVAGLHTAHGLLGYRLALEGGQVTLALDAGLAQPPGGLWWSWQGRLHRVPAGQTSMTLPADR